MSGKVKKGDIWNVRGDFFVKRRFNRLALKLSGKRGFQGCYYTMWELKVKGV